MRKKNIEEEERVRRTKVRRLGINPRRSTQLHHGKGDKRE